MNDKHVVEIVHMQQARIVDALRRYEAAEFAYEQASRTLEAARVERDEAKRHLREQTEGHGRMLIGNKLLTRNAQGGLIIEHVDIFGNVGS